MPYNKESVSPPDLYDVDARWDDKNHPTKPSYAPVGITGLTRFANFVYEEFITDLRYPQAASVYFEMSENDATVGAILYLAEQLVRRVEWTVEPASDDKTDIDTAKFVEECMHDMGHSWNDTLSEILSMMVYGWSFHEIVYKIRRGPEESNGKYRSKYTDGKIGWRDFPVRSQHTLYGWRFTEASGPVAMLQWAPPHYVLTEIPFSKGLLFRTKIRRNNPEGKSLLRNAYRSWYFKKRIEEIEGIGIERDLAGLPVLQPPENVAIWDKENPLATSLRSQAEQLVRNIRRDKCEGVVIPFGWDLKLLSSGGTRQFNTNEIINRYDQRIAMTMLADIVLIGAEKTGSFALSDVKKSLMGAALEALLMAIADVFNKNAVHFLMEMNNIKCPNGYPRITPEDIEAPTMEDVAKIFKATGLKLDADLELYNYVRKLLQVKPIAEDEFDKLREQQLEFATAGNPFNSNSARQDSATQQGNGTKERGNNRATEGDSFDI